MGTRGSSLSTLLQQLEVTEVTASYTCIMTRPNSPLCFIWTRIDILPAFEACSRIISVSFGVFLSTCTAQGRPPAKPASDHCRCPQYLDIGVQLRDSTDCPAHLLLVAYVGAEARPIPARDALLATVRWPNPAQRKICGRQHRYVDRH